MKTISYMSFKHFRLFNEQSVNQELQRDHFTIIFSLSGQTLGQKKKLGQEEINCKTIKVSHSRVIQHFLASSIISFSPKLTLTHKKKNLWDYNRGLLAFSFSVHLKRSNT